MSSWDSGVAMSSVLVMDPYAELDTHWRALKIRFDAEAPHWIARSFSMLPAVDRTLIERLVTDGKSARGCLTCLVCEALGGTFEEALPRAVAIECIQAATLVHDDFVDGDTVRREQAALWTTLGARRAVLLGDLMFATALAQGARLGLADVAALAEAVATVAAGAYHEPMDARDLDEKLHNGSGAMTLYERVIHCKTGVLFGAAGKLGAIAAGATPQQITAAYAFATRIGEAYQMADDTHDLLTVIDANGAPPALNSQHAATLATIHAHLHASDTLHGITAAVLEDGGEPERHTRRKLRSQMEQEISRRLGLARLELSGLISGPTGALLNAAPAFIVKLQDVRRHSL